MITKALIAVIQVYQRCLSPFLGQACRFYPSCSSYSIAALSTYGFWRGLYLSFRRLIRCHPWHPGGYDPIP
jgi:putative membrane protein insertion efficiency factor